MTTPKPRYDSDGSWKNRQYDEAGWEKVKERLRRDLRPFHPDKNAQATPPFGHPADTWANILLAESEDVLSLEQWLFRRLTKAELRAEQADILKTLKKAERCLGRLSYDLDIMLGVDADIRGCCDKIRELTPRLEAAEATINQLPRAKKLRDIQHDAAVEMAVRVLRILKNDGISIAATANKDSPRASNAVRILKIIGDAIGLPLSEVTWKDIIIEAKPSIPPRR